jgi:hypothetical protein
VALFVLNLWLQSSANVCSTVFFHQLIICPFIETLIAAESAVAAAAAGNRVARWFIFRPKIPFG